MLFVQNAIAIEDDNFMLESDVTSEGVYDKEYISPLNATTRTKRFLKTFDGAAHSLLNCTRISKIGKFLWTKGEKIFIGGMHVKGHTIVPKIYRKVTLQYVISVPDVKRLDDVFSTTGAMHCPGGSGSSKCGKGFGGFNADQNSAIARGSETLYWSAVYDAMIRGCFWSWGLLDCFALTIHKAIVRVDIYRVIDQTCHIEIDGEEIPDGQPVHWESTAGPIAMTLRIDCPSEYQRYFGVSGTQLRDGPYSTLMTLAEGQSPIYSLDEGVTWASRRPLFHVRRKGQENWEVEIPWPGRISEDADINLDAQPKNKVAAFSRQMDKVSLAYELHSPSCTDTQIFEAKKEVKCVCSISSITRAHSLNAAAYTNMAKGSCTTHSHDKDRVCKFEVKFKGEAYAVRYIAMASARENFGFVAPSKSGELCVGITCISTALQGVSTPYGHDAHKSIDKASSGFRFPNFGFAGGILDIIGTIKKLEKYVPLFACGALAVWNPAITASPFFKYAIFASFAWVLVGGVEANTASDLSIENSVAYHSLIFIVSAVGTRVLSFWISCYLVALAFIIYWKGFTAMPIKYRQRVLYFILVIPTLMELDPIEKFYGSIRTSVPTFIVVSIVHYFNENYEYSGWQKECLLLLELFGIKWHHCVPLITYFSSKTSFVNEVVHDFVTLAYDAKAYMTGSTTGWRAPTLHSSGSIAHIVSVFVKGSKVKHYPYKFALKRCKKTTCTQVKQIFHDVEWKEVKNYVRQMNPIKRVKLCKEAIYPESRSPFDLDWFLRWSLKHDRDGMVYLGVF